MFACFSVQTKPISLDEARARYRAGLRLLPHSLSATPTTAFDEDFNSIATASSDDTITGRGGCSTASTNSSNDNSINSSISNSGENESSLQPRHFTLLPPAATEDAAASAVKLATSPSALVSSIYSKSSVRAAPATGVAEGVGNERRTGGALGATATTTMMTVLNPTTTSPQPSSSSPMSSGLAMGSTSSYQKSGGSGGGTGGGASDVVAPQSHANDGQPPATVSVGGVVNGSNDGSAAATAPRSEQATTVTTKRRSNVDTKEADGENQESPPPPSASPVTTNQAAGLSFPALAGSAETRPSAMEAQSPEGLGRNSSNTACPAAVEAPRPPPTSRRKSKTMSSEEILTRATSAVSRQLVPTDVNSNAPSGVEKDAGGGGVAAVTTATTTTTHAIDNVRSHAASNSSDKTPATAGSFGGNDSTTPIVGFRKTDAPPSDDVKRESSAFPSSSVQTGGGGGASSVGSIGSFLRSEKRNRTVADDGTPTAATAAAAAIITATENSDKKEASAAIAAVGSTPLVLAAASGAVAVSSKFGLVTKVTPLSGPEVFPPPLECVIDMGWQGAASGKLERGCGGGTIDRLYGEHCLEREAAARAFFDEQDVLRRRFYAAVDLVELDKAVECSGLELRNGFRMVQTLKMRLKTRWQQETVLQNGGGGISRCTSKEAQQATLRWQEQIKVVIADHKELLRDLLGRQRLEAGSLQMAQEMEVPKGNAPPLRVRFAFPRIFDEVKLQVTLFEDATEGGGGREGMLVVHSVGVRLVVRTAFVRLVL